VQWFRYGRRTVTVEEIREVEAPHRLAYTVVSGLPLKHYRAEVTLTRSAAGGTSVRWAATWDRTFLGRLVQNKLQRVYGEVMSALMAAAERTATPPPPWVT
jgi:hypothetical protein